MKKLSGWLALGVVVAIAAAQGNGKEVLNGFVKTVNSADSLSVQYTAQMVGQGTKEYSLELAKPNKARIESDSQLIVADGTNITTYDKAAKTYFKSEQTTEDLMKLFNEEDLSIWKTFFDGKTFDKISNVKAQPNRTIAGQSFKVVDVSMNPDGSHMRTLFIDTKNLVRRSQTVMKGSSESLTTIYIAKAVETGTANSEKFAFKAPEGSREVSLEEMTSAVWFTDLEEAKKVAAKTKRKIFVDFYADW